MLKENRDDAGPLWRGRWCSLSSPVCYHCIPQLFIVLHSVHTDPLGENRGHHHFGPSQIHNQSFVFVTWCEQNHLQLIMAKFSKIALYASLSPLLIHPTLAESSVAEVRSVEIE